MSDEEKKTDPSAEAFPLGVRYKLDSGASIEVHKWSVRTLTRFTQRVPLVVEKFMDADKDKSIVTLFPELLDEITEVIAESVGVDAEDIQENWSAEDLLGVAILVWDTCLQGLLAKTLGLTIRFQGLLGGPVAETPETTTTPEPPSSEPSAS